MVGLRWAMRGVGLLSTFVLAHLLTPGDFGLVAMAMLVVGLVDVCGQAGQQLALIRLAAPTREDFDSVWTLGLLVALAVAAVLWAVAPLAAWYFQAPVAGLIRLLALRPLLTACDNIGVVAFRRELRFGREFAFQFAQRLAAAGVTIAAALWLGDARALVAGLLGGPLFGVALSYALHPYRPRWCTRRIRPLLAFSGWMLLVNLAQYVQERGDAFVVGGIADAAALGRYEVAADAAAAPTQELVLPATRAIFPVFARLGEAPAALRAAVLDVFAAAWLVALPAGVGLALVAADVVAVALGPRWLAAVPLLRLLALSGALSGLLQAGVTVLAAIGQARLGATLTAGRALLLLPALAAAGWLGGVAAVAAMRAAVTLLCVPGLCLAVARVLPVTPAELFAPAWRPLAAAAVMAAVVTAVQAAAPDLPALRLALAVAAGAASYAGTVLLLWQAARRQ